MDLAARAEVDTPTGNLSKGIGGNASFVQLGFGFWAAPFDDGCAP